MVVRDKSGDTPKIVKVDLFPCPSNLLATSLPRGVLIVFIFVPHPYRRGGF